MTENQPMELSYVSFGIGSTVMVTMDVKWIKQHRARNTITQKSI